MLTDYLVAGGKPYTAAAPREVRLVKFLADARQIALGDPAAVVLHGDGDMSVAVYDPDRDDTALVGIFDRIVNDVYEHLAQAVAVGVDYWHILVRHIENERFALRLCARLIGEHSFLHLGEDIAWAHAHREPARLEPREIEQLLDHLRQSVRLFDYDF